MIASSAFIVIAVAGLLCGVVSSFVIVGELQKRGVKVNVFLLRILIIKYVSDYARVTREETGKPGPWFYTYITAMCIALCSAILALVLR